MQIDQQKLEQFFEKAFGDLSAAYAGVMISLGSKLGLYAVMENAGPLTSDEIAQRQGAPSVTFANGFTVRSPVIIWSTIQLAIVTK